MPVPFPALAPSSRSYLPPGYAVTLSRSRQGVVTPREWLDTPSDGELTLSFDNRTGAAAALLLRCWHDADGIFDTLTLPAILFSGSGPELEEVIIPPDAPQVWAWLEKPALSSVPPNRSTVRVRLAHQLRML